MALFEITESGLKSIPESTFQEKQIREREDLQRLLKANIGVLSSNLLIIAEEFGDWEDSNRRIDLLAIDKKANLVVIELKRTTDGGHMELQAVRYAAMISAMTFAQACRAYENYLKNNNVELEAEQEILDFLEWTEPDEELFAQDIRIILASADFSKEITTAVIWLNERGLDIRCYRLKPHDMDGKTILDIQQIIPLPEAEAFQVKVREKSQAERTSRAQKERWDLQRLLSTIKENAGEACSKAALDIHNWCESNMDNIWWSKAKVDGSFMPGHIGTKHEFYFFAVRSTGKIEFYFGQMLKKQPFDDEGLRKQFITRLNAFGANIPEKRHDRYPKFPLDLLTKQENMQKFKDTILWAIEEVRRVDESD